MTIHNLFLAVAVTSLIGLSSQGLASDNEKNDLDPGDAKSSPSQPHIVEEDLSQEEICLIEEKLKELRVSSTHQYKEISESLDRINVELNFIKLAMKFPLVQDKRNYKKDSGSKSFGPYGAVHETFTRGMVVNKQLIALNDDGKLAKSNTPWRYVVALNCKRNGRPVKEIIENLVTKLLPPFERHRLAIILGINERITLATAESSRVTVGKLEQFHVPILILQSAWMAFRKSTRDPKLKAHEVRAKILKELRILKEKNLEAYKYVLAQLCKSDKSHSFPFGQMRSHLLNHPLSKNFIKGLHAEGVHVYIHIQDSDFVELSTQPYFTESSILSRVAPTNDNFLFKRYDDCISQRWMTTGMLPIIVGGAYTFSPQEELEEAYTQDAKYWTRFTNEMSNLVKHLIGQYHPQGLYFHEPNTLILSPPSIEANFLHNESTQTLKDKQMQKNLHNFIQNGFEFGIDSELKELTKKLFKNVGEETCRNLMFFSCSAILATSQKRGAGECFTIRFGGEYEPTTSTFSGWSYDDLVSLHGMPQENLLTNKWMSPVTTGFREHCTQDSRTKISNLYNLLNPHYIAGKDYTPEDFYDILVNYDHKLNKAKLKQYYSLLTNKYNKKGQGMAKAFEIVSLAWECGQAMRVMFLGHLLPPKKLENSVNLQDIKGLIFCRYRDSYLGSGLASNAFTYGLIGLDALPKEIKPKVDNKVEKKKGK